MKIKLALFMIFYFAITIAVRAQEKNLIYTNPDYSFSVTHFLEFENPKEETVGEIKTFRFLDLDIDITIQPVMTLEEAKNAYSVLQPNSLIKVRSKTFNENKYIAMIENESGKLLKMVEILIYHKYTYFIKINKPVDFEQGQKQLKMFNLINF